MVILTVFTGCAQTRIHGASSFSQTAIAYQDTLPPLLDESFNAALRENSRQLIRTREVLTEDGRSGELDSAEKRLEKQFEVVQHIKEQVQLLRSVFAALGALADLDTETKIGEATKSLVEELGEVNTTAKDLEILKGNDFEKQRTAIEGAVAAGAGLAVAQVKSAGIRQFLTDYGDTINTSLEVQEQLLDVVGKQLAFYKKADLRRRYTEQVFEPYVFGSDPALDAWTAKRLAFYKAQVDISRVTVAKKAARNVRIAFTALAENRLSVENIALIVEDIQQIRKFISAVKEVGESDATS